METTKNRIKRMTEILNITQKELAQKAHIRESSISNYVKGISEPGQKTIKKIAETFHISPSWLMGYGNDEDIRNMSVFDWFAEEDDKITSFDEMLIAAYHDSPKSTQNIINTLLDLENND